MGHSTARAALVHQHATAERERLIARSVSDLVTRARTSGSRSLPAPDGHGTGTPG
ncbi:integrase [Streptomyces sp. NPDC001380]|uniref:integrase n=1 Tax=Streptomyces sp. NPDC001380 TaxID=3364566 RepID=UPI00369C325C